jgi:hypothetical protein
VGRSEAGSAVEATTPAEPDAPRPDWNAVLTLLSVLAETRAVFPTTNASSNWISAYEPERRVMVESGASGARSSWVQVDHIRTCWDRFERRGRICRDDVLEPGRRSAFMMAVFQQLPGVSVDGADTRYLVFAADGERG